MLDDLLYRRGFLVLPRQMAIPSLSYLEAWGDRQIGSWRLLTHPETPVLLHEHPRGTAVVLGDLFAAHGDSSVEECLDRYLIGDLRVLDDLSGRFALLGIHGEDLRAVQDPIGAQTVFIADRRRALSSHSALLAETFDLPRSPGMYALMQMPEQKAKITRFLPGDRTLFDEVRLLVPNTEGNLGSGRTRRYWPHEPLADTTESDVLRVWDEYFTQYAEHLRGYDEVVLGLTGGVDSRGMIAALRDKGLSMRYETWSAMQEAERSRIPGMIEHLGGDHRWLDIRERVETEEGIALTEAGRRAGGYTRGTPTMPALAAHGARPGGVFVYGHGGGVTAGSFSLRAKAFLPPDPLDRACYLHAGPQRKTSSAAYKKANRDGFAEFLRRAEYPRADGDGADRLHGIDPGLLLYWEHRMANWAALQIAVHSIGLTAHAGINSRRIYAAFWGLPEPQHKKALHQRLIQEYDPVLAEL